MLEGIYMQDNNIEKTKNMVGIALLIAIVVVLQIFGSFIRLGAFPVSLVLVPIVIGAAVYGQAAGAVLGGAFGVVVLINCINGVDVGGHMLWQANPALTAALCMVKGIAAGYVSGLVYRFFAKKSKYIGVLFAAFICPVVNTGIFLFAMIFLYRETLLIWAGDSHFLYYSFITLAGVNFLLELCVNLVLSPAVLRIINASKS